jgi:hypothetical protein
MIRILAGTIIVMLLSGLACADVNFQRWLQSIWPDAHKLGV